MSDSSYPERLTTEVRGNTLIITMVRHDKRNAIDGEMTLALDEACLLYTSPSPRDS